MTRSFAKGVIIGNNQTGKSYFIKNGLYKSIKNSGQDKKFIIISDAPDDETLGRIKRIRSFAELKRWKNGGLVHFWDNDWAEDHEEVGVIAEIYRLAKIGLLQNGTLVFDDATGYIQGSMPKIVGKLLQSYRHFFLDVFFVFHAINDIPPLMWRKLDRVYLKKTADINKSFRWFEKDRGVPNAHGFYQAYNFLQKIHYSQKPQIYTTICVEMKTEKFYQVKI